MEQNIVEKARAFALARHGDQKYGEKPYSDHLQAVCNALRNFANPRNTMLAAAWLHDVLEDTETTREELTAEFGKEVTDLVWAVTGDDKLSRGESTKLTIQKLKAHPRAALLKLADRYANVSASLEEKKVKYLTMYVKEHKQYMEVFPSSILLNLYVQKIEQAKDLLT
jgi:(p)ppGpp synthase/HD superfamily hydrolase